MGVILNDADDIFWGPEPVSIIYYGGEIVWERAGPGYYVYRGPLPISLTGVDSLSEYRLYGTVGGLGLTNLFDKDSVTRGKGISGTSIVNKSSWCVTDFIPVKGGAKYVCRIYGTYASAGRANFGAQILEYTAKDAAPTLSAQTASVEGFTVDSTTNYIRLNLLTSYINAAEVYESGGTPWYVPYGVYQINLISGTANLYDENAKDTANGYMANSALQWASSGQPTIVSHQAFDITEYIEIEANKHYFLLVPDNTSGAPSICFYNSSKGFISALKYDLKGAVEFTAPSNTKYCRFTVQHDTRNALYGGERVTINLNSPLESGEYISYSEGLRHNADGTTTALTLPEIPVEGTTTISFADIADTEQTAQGYVRYTKQEGGE